MRGVAPVLAQGSSSPKMRYVFTTTSSQELQLGNLHLETLSHWNLPQLQRLTLSGRFNQPLAALTRQPSFDSLLSQLRSLTLGHRFDQSLEQLHMLVNLEYLSLGDAFNQGWMWVPFFGPSSTSPIQKTPTREELHRTHSVDSFVFAVPFDMWRCTQSFSKTQNQCNESHQIISPLHQESIGKTHMVGTADILGWICQPARQHLGGHTLESFIRFAPSLIHTLLLSAFSNQPPQKKGRNQRRSSHPQLGVFSTHLHVQLGVHWGAKSCAS